MIDATQVPPVGDDELLARFILQRSHVRSDQTVKPDAFMPPPNLELSVTRHLLATEAEVWSIGQSVAAIRQRTLQGRADLATRESLRRQLSVLAAAIDGNPNHANVVGWPGEKARQKNLAQEIAAAARYVRTPSG